MGRLLPGGEGKLALGLQALGVGHRLVGDPASGGQLPREGIYRKASDVVVALVRGV
jgi:hypothetical protein